MKTFISFNSNDYCRLFSSLGFDLTNSLEEAELVVFTGGWDVNPEYYNKGVHHTTRTNAARDLADIEVYNNSAGKMKVGICRGGQFLHVMNGGTLVQDVNYHARHDSHPLECEITGKEWNVTSTHHQMMNPLDKVGAFVGTAFQTFVGAVVEDGEEVSIELPTNPEVVFHKDSMCFQPHPEFYGAHETKNCFEHFLNIFLAERGVNLHA